jgi:cell division protein FtsI/penicillin-binding protein 2
MKTFTWILIFLAILTACQTTNTPEAVPSPSVLPASSPSPAASATPSATSTPAPPDPRAQATAFLDKWQADDYEGMYDQLTSASRDAISQEDFINHFRDINIEAALKSIDYEILSVETSASEAAARYKITLQSNLVPDVQDETSMKLVMEDGQWRIVWEDTIVMSYLSGSNYLSMNRDGEYTPPRGQIFDRNGDLLVGEDDVYAVGLNLLAYDPEMAESIVNTLSRMSGTPAEVVQARIEDAVANALPYLAFGEYNAQKALPWLGALNSLSAIDWNNYRSRFYYGSPFFGSAPHAIGYVGQINAEQLDAFRRLGYRKDEMVGQVGLENWAENDLIGKRGGVLAVRDGNYQVIQTLAEATAVPSQNITTTLEMDFQIGVERAFYGLAGAAVVIERDTGRILAMASSPTFDPNAFDTKSLNSFTELSNLNSPLRPLYNRATQGIYPLGSVFKIITMAAALESGLFTADSTYECGYAFTDVPGIRLYDWTWEHFLEDDETQPSGQLTLPQGLIRSCNPFFYHIGQILYEAGLTTAISDMARAFGLGSPTGIQGVTELPGNVPDPDELEEALYLATGQSELQVTPLQVASFVAAVGNGGSLYKPQIIEQMAPPGGEPSLVFEPEILATLPVKPENLALIQQAMGDVVSSTKPVGTAYYVFRGFQIPVFGKTGTAQTGVLPHAWFAAYTNANYPNRPDIAVAVIVENGGEGSEWAAPITRRILELYFLGYPAKLFPWEASYNVWETPEPPGEESEP